MRYKAADHEVKLYCEFHQQYLEWEANCSAVGPFDPLLWNCPGLQETLRHLNGRRLGIERQALVSYGPDYPSDARRLPPFEEWSTSLQVAVIALDKAVDQECDRCRESWKIEIAPITWARRNDTGPVDLEGGPTRT